MDHPLQDFYSTIYSTYDKVNRIFTFGRDRAWRRKVARLALEHRPSRVLDVCTGTGDFILEVARQASGRGPVPELEGYDQNREMLQLAREKALDLAAEASIRFTEGPVAQLPYDSDRFDVLGITFGIRNLLFENSQAETHLSELVRVLRPGGRLLILESSRPANPLWRLFNNIYLRFVLPYLGGLFSGNLNAYRYLARSSKNYYSRSEMAEILQGAGLKLVADRPLFLGSVMMVEAEK